MPTAAARSPWRRARAASRCASAGTTCGRVVAARVTGGAREAREAERLVVAAGAVGVDLARVEFAVFAEEEIDAHERRVVARERARPRRGAARTRASGRARARAGRRGRAPAALDDRAHHRLGGATRRARGARARARWGAGRRGARRRRRRPTRGNAARARAGARARAADRRRRSRATWGARAHLRRLPRWRSRARGPPRRSRRRRRRRSVGSVFVSHAASVDERGGRVVVPELVRLLGLRRCSRGRAPGSRRARAARSYVSARPSASRYVVKRTPPLPEESRFRRAGRRRPSGVRARRLRAKRTASTAQPESIVGPATLPEKSSVMTRKRSVYCASAVTSNASPPARRSASASRAAGRRRASSRGGRFAATVATSWVTPARALAGSCSRSSSTASAERRDVARGSWRRSRPTRRRRAPSRFARRRRRSRCPSRSSRRATRCSPFAGAAPMSDSSCACALASAGRDGAVGVRKRGNRARRRG